jgi:nucleoid-associated protein YgaU
MIRTADRWKAAGAVLLALLGAAQAAPGTAQAPRTEAVGLVAGCNLVSLTWPSGTPPRTVALSTSPAAALAAIWKFDNPSQRFIGYSPLPNVPNDLVRVAQLDPAFVCVRESGTLTRPVMVLLDGAGAASTNTAAGVPQHTVAPGETLFAIARRWYGDERAWQRIFDANRDVITDPADIAPGMVLRLPR